jgi:hypothetical protein
VSGQEPFLFGQVPQAVPIGPRREGTEAPLESWGALPVPRGALAVTRGALPVPSGAVPVPRGAVPTPRDDVRRRRRNSRRVTRPSRLVARAGALCAEKDPARRAALGAREDAIRGRSCALRTMSGTLTGPLEGVPFFGSAGRRPPGSPSVPRANARARAKAKADGCWARPGRRSGGRYIQPRPPRCPGRGASSTPRRCAPGTVR